jgi:hypothetical protein
MGGGKGKVRKSVTGLKKGQAASADARRQADHGNAEGLKG